MTLGITGKLILAFVTLLLGVVFVGVVATQGLVVTDKDVVSNEAQTYTLNTTGTGINVSETHTVTNAPTGWKTTDCPLTSVSIKNVSGGDALTEDTDYTLTDSAGTWVFIDTDATDAMNASSTAYVDYTYCGDDYLNLGWGRTMINLVGGFFAIAVLLVSIGLFFSVAKDTGML